MQVLLLEMRILGSTLSWVQVRKPSGHLRHESHGVALEFDCLEFGLVQALHTCENLNAYGPLLNFLRQCLQHFSGQRAERIDIVIPCATKGLGILVLLKWAQTLHTDSSALSP